MADSPSSSGSSDYEDAHDGAAKPSPDKPHEYRLRVTAGPAYDASTHHPVKVNSSERSTIDTPSMTVEYAIRIKHFTGLPASNETSPYFEHHLHTSDQYSISLAFIPKVDIPGSDLVFGNDFDRPIRDRLPPGFNQAFKFVKWWIDPGLEGDVYADKPYLYGPALSSWNTLRICDPIEPTDKPEKYAVPDPEKFHGDVVEEGASSDAAKEYRTSLGVPDDSAARKKYFLTEAHRESFTFEKGRLYQADFFNPYLDFNDFSLKLPGFSLNVIKYVDAKTHELRYVLKNKKTDELYIAIMFTLLWGEEEAKEAERLGDGHKGGEDKGQVDEVTKKTEALKVGESSKKKEEEDDIDAGFDDDVD
ncbi:uncharacterized protein AB675_806 [Cyphellophora attinorum]|uniref:Domain of unknown function at the cortex 1 domain-containing protein n=1 Tax=Cyphellophora attinorum TaxID=1664694 RepID=A0A0N1HYJ7_9EURO|nr:uncharacterized protein AB675_806 [Phialophora attinorum]KPI45927.1 hypothetical protein AB675_806 [Phialophora attinorum]